MPIGESRVVLALHGWLAASDTDEGHFVPFYLQPSLGGHNTLRSYADYRFHDRHLLIFNAEARIPMMTHVDAAVFLDAGNVAARLAGSKSRQAIVRRWAPLCIHAAGRLPALTSHTAAKDGSFSSG